MIAKLLVVVLETVPIEILNAGNIRITLPTVENIAEFTFYQIMIHMWEWGTIQNVISRNKELVNENIEIVEGQYLTLNPSKYEDWGLNIAAEFCKKFHLSEDLSETQLLQ